MITKISHRWVGMIQQKCSKGIHLEREQRDAADQYKRSHPCDISLLDSTAGIELGEWPGDTQAEERVWHIFYDKEKIVGSLLDPLATNAFLQQRTSEPPHGRGDLIAGCSNINGKEMLPLTLEKTQNYQRQYGNRMNAP